MRKLRLNLGEGGIKGLFLQHGEKAGMLIVLILAAMFFATGYSVEGIPKLHDSGKPFTPSGLRDLADEGKRHIERQDVWEILKNSEDRNPTMDHVTKLEGHKDIAITNYRNDLPWVSFVSQSKERRSDPDLFEPLKPEVRLVQAAVSFAPADGVTDHLSTAPLAPLKAPDKKKKSSKKDTAPMDAAGGGDAAAMMAAAAGAGTGEAESAVPIATGGGKVRTVTPGIISLLNDRFPNLWRVKGSAFSGSSAKAVAKGRYVVSVNALVPWQNQWEEFKQLELQVGYLPSRDTPQYIWFEAERADVTDNPDATDEELESLFKPIANTNSETWRAENEWYGRPDEICELTYKDPMLTMSIPPLAMCDYGKISRHSEVPQRDLAPKTVAKPKAGDSKSSRPDFFNGSGPDSPMPGGRPGGSGGGGSSSPTMTPGGSGDESGFPMDMIGGSTDSGGDSAAEMMNAGGANMGGGSGGGGTSMGGGSNDKLAPPPVPYKLLRFFDLNADPGRIYRYRVRVWLQDPNNPRQSTRTAGTDSSTKLRDEMLKDEVVARLRKVREDDQTKAKRTGRPAQTWWRMTKWSEVTEPIRVPKHYRETLASKVISPQSTTISNVRFSRSEPLGVVAATAWDSDLAVNVAAEVNVFRSSVLNFKTDAQVLHPLTWRFHELAGYDLHTDAIVLDIRGGESLPSNSRQEDITAPGEFLIVDAEGNLLVQNEVDDLENYRLRMMIAEETSGSSSGVGTSMPMGMDPGVGDAMNPMNPMSGGGGSPFGDFGM